MMKKHWRRLTTGFSILTAFALLASGGCVSTDPDGLGASAIDFVRELLLNGVAAFLL